jgi:hypothetical protein
LLLLVSSLQSVDERTQAKRENSNTMQLLRIHLRIVITKLVCLYKYHRIHRRGSPLLASLKFKFQINSFLLFPGPILCGDFYNQIFVFVNLVLVHFSYAISIQYLKFCLFEREPKFGVQWVIVMCQQS